jgi:flagellar hook-associated protein 3 FlgL
MRITEVMKIAGALASTTATTARLHRASAIASSGSRINDPSDDAGGYAEVARIDAQLSGVKARSATAGRAADELDLAETTLAAGADLAMRMREIAVAMSNGAVDAQTRKNVADEVDGLRARLLGLANTRGATGYLFGGSKTQTEPFDVNANFVGDDDPRMVELSPNITLRANASGAQAFTVQGGIDPFAAMTNFANALRTNNVAAVQQGIADADGIERQITRARADTGSRAGELRNALDVMESVTLSLQKTRSALADADVASAYGDLTTARGDYERAIEIARQLLQLGGMKPGG